MNVQLCFNCGKNLPLIPSPVVFAKPCRYCSVLCHARFILGRLRRWGHCGA